MNRYRPLILSMILTMVVLAVFWPVQQYEFLNFDDQVYVTDNVHVRGGLSLSSVKWAFLSTEAGFWHPLTWLSLMLDYELFRLNAGGYHWTNVLIHLLSALLLFMTFYRMTGALYRSWIVALLFALHPLHVEPVAWVAARKDILSGLFWMLSMWFYVRYVEQPGVGRYIWVALFFLMGLMSKPMVVTLPFVLLLLDYWPLGRYGAVSLRRLIGEKIPLLIMVIPVTYLTFAAEAEVGALAKISVVTFDVRLANILSSYCLYLLKIIWPVNLAAFYPYNFHYSLVFAFLFGALIIIISILAILFSKRHPCGVVGWFWYLIVMLPVIGIFQIGSHAMADRYTYLSLTGIFAFASWSTHALTSRLVKGKTVFFVVIITMILTISFISKSQLFYWKDSVTLFAHAIRVTGTNFFSEHNLGAALLTAGYPEEAIQHLKQSVRLETRFAESWTSLGKAFLFLNQVDDAAVYIDKALEIDPLNEQAIFAKAMIMEKRRDLHSALGYYERVLAVNPNRAEAYYNRGAIHTGQAKYLQAVESYRQALRILPEYAAAHNNLGIVLSRLGRHEEAIFHFREALRIDPGLSQAADNLSIYMRKSGSR